ncbi:MAG: hypothetical protein SGJ13_05055 [Actinomycetota bacterium]|nr:hypothetical protein [Actinomycetota bacterium]
MQRRTVAALAAVVAATTLAACSRSGEQSVVVRNPDDVQVMSPDEVADMREAVANPDEAGEAGEAADATGATVPQNEDDRPVEARMFEAFTTFRDCLADDGYELEGDPRDPNNPAMQNPDYVAALTKCAARSNIAEIFQEMQAAAENYTPEQVEERNEGFLTLADCLERRGWIIETSTNEIGLIQPSTFTNAQGELDERDIEQCVAETGIELE